MAHTLSIVDLHLQTSNDLLLNRFFLQRRLRIALHSRPHPISRIDCSCPVVAFQPKSVKKRTVPRLQRQIVSWAKEVQQPKTIQVGLVCGRGNDAVNSRLEITVCPELEHIGNVDRDGSGVGFDPLLATVGHAHLESGNWLAEKEGLNKSIPYSSLTLGNIAEGTHKASEV